MRTYYTLIRWYPGEDDTDPGCWADEFGSYSRREVEEEKEWAHSDAPRGHVKIIKHVDGTAAMMKARDTTPPPKR